MYSYRLAAWMSLRAYRQRGSNFSKNSSKLRRPSLSLSKRRSVCCTSDMGRPKPRATTASSSTVMAPSLLVSMASKMHRALSRSEAPSGMCARSTLPAPCTSAITSASESCMRAASAGERCAACMRITSRSGPASSFRAMFSASSSVRKPERSTSAARNALRIRGSGSTPRRRPPRPRPPWWSCLDTKASYIWPEFSHVW
mmetsp:Transcript_7009/g.23947  ORF Transcript_7009/g.23947 Transcript_7009/m.23947 type:complete len:200 (-) Transcript_7009:699-1298(-)